MRKIVLATLVAAMPMPALATTDTNKQVAYVGANAGYAYVHFTSALSGSCGGDIAYIDLSTDTGKAMYTIAMSARMAGTVVTRIDYTNSGGTCYANLIET